MAVLLFFVLPVVVLAIWLYAKWRFNFWARKGLENLDAGIFEFGDQFERLYKTLKQKGLKHGGTYLFTKPYYVPIDLDLLKNILIKDFEHFVNHGIGNIDPDKDPLGAHLLNLRDDRWRQLRVKLTPTFTSGKLRMMFSTLADATKLLVPVLEEHAKFGTPVEIKEVMARLTTDIIGSVAFGLEINSLQNPNSEFRIYGKKIFENVPMQILTKFLLPTFIREYYRGTDTPQNFFQNIVDKTIAYREKNNVQRNDFLHLLLQLKNRGQVYDDGKIMNDDNTTNFHMSMNELASNCFIFFFAGFETSSTLMNFAFYELSRHQDMQDKLRKEINTVLAESNGDITYDGIMKMEYLDKVVYESLRLHPPGATLDRKCNKDYPVPGTDFVIEKGTAMLIPIGLIQTDPEHYPNPLEFNPENFTQENKSKRHPMSLLTFGEGPRMCIGSRFGLLQAKVGLVASISKFRFTINNKTKYPLEYNSKFIGVNVKGGIWLNVEKLQ